VNQLRIADFGLRIGKAESVARRARRQLAGGFRNPQSAIRNP